MFVSLFVLYLLICLFFQESLNDTPFLVSRDLQIRMVLVQHALGIFGIVRGIVGT